MKRTVILLALTTCIFSNKTLWAGPNAKEIIKKVKAKYESLENLQADFEQTFKWELAGETQTVKGTLYLMHGNNYRIETEAQEIVTDGTTVWTYSKQGDQVIIDLLDKSEENALPKDLLFQYSEDFKPTLVGESKLNGKKVYVLTLSPKNVEESFIKSMKIWVDADTWVTSQVEQTDINDNVQTYVINNIRDNVVLTSDLFKFKIPAEAEVVDLRDNE